MGPRVPLKSQSHAPTCRIDRGHPPSKQMCLGVDRVYAPQNARMLWRCITAGTKKRLRGIRPINHPPKHFACSGDCPRSIRHVGARDWLLIGTLGAHFRQRRSWSGWLLCVVATPGPELTGTLAYYIPYRWNRLVNRKSNDILKSVVYVGFASKWKDQSYVGVNFLAKIYGCVTIGLRVLRCMMKIRLQGVLDREQLWKKYLWYDIEMIGWGGTVG